MHALRVDDLDADRAEATSPVTAGFIIQIVQIMRYLF